MQMMMKNEKIKKDCAGSSTTLCNWIETEARKQLTTKHRPDTDGVGTKRERQGMLLRKTTVAYGIAELLRHYVRSRPSAAASSNKPEELQLSQLTNLLAEQCSISNFSVRTNATESISSVSAWNNIHSVSMKSPQAMAVNLFEPSFLYSADETSTVGGTGDEDMGTYLEVEFPCSIDLSNETSGGMADMDLGKMKGGDATETADKDADSEKASAVSVVNQQQEENFRCYLLGMLLYEIYSNLSPFPGDKTLMNRGNGPILSHEPALKKAKLTSSAARSSLPFREEFLDKNSDDEDELLNPIYNPHQMSARDSLIQIGIPSSICLLVHNLLECAGWSRSQDAYDSLDTVCTDLHLLLLDPSRFLFDRMTYPSSSTPSFKSCADEVVNTEQNHEKEPQLSFREYKLYGRENEVSSITDAFCRVSDTGKSEAFFIGGYSGSGKSMLVNSLRARVDMVGGYVLSHKFDKISSKERSLLDIISTFDYLCRLIQNKSSPQDLSDIANRLKTEFAADFTTLNRLIPSIEIFYSHPSRPIPFPQKGVQFNNKPRSYDEKGEDGEDGKVITVTATSSSVCDQMNLTSICFILKRFLRVVSSKSHPVMLFLDDLQWCDSSAFMVVEGILVDTIGSSCIFFVGTYRSNEVIESPSSSPDQQHPVLRFIDSLKSFCVLTTIINLEGVSPLDLNTLLSDAMCMFPRLCKPLSDIIFQKTKGNPFFVLAFIKSLKNEGSLKFSTDKRRWVWDEDHISSMDITDNVLNLVFTKMNGLPDTIQSALKVAACFGTKMKQSVVGYLCQCSGYSGIRGGLDQVVKEGFMVKLGTSDYKFVHDKVREAAYSLLRDDEKKPYHYDLGMALRSVANTNDTDDIIFSIVDQINRGLVDLPPQSTADLRNDHARLFERAGIKAASRSDHAAARSYVGTALSLMPPHHWQSDYGLSLPLSILLAKSAFSCGDVGLAEDTLKEVLRESRSIQDKLPAYYLLATVLYTQGRVVDAYNTCSEVLTLLGEDIPISFDQKETTKIVAATTRSMKRISTSTLMEMKVMNEDLCSSLKFYNLICIVSFFAKPEMLAHLVCRSVQLTMKNGIGENSIFGLVHFAAMLVSGKKMAKGIQDACRIGEAAMTCWKSRFHRNEALPKLYEIYYAWVAFYTEPLQTCADAHRRGFDVGMSLGDTGTAFFNAMQHISCLFWAGEKLPTVLEKIDCYLELALFYKSDLVKNYLTIFRKTVSVLIDKGESTSQKGKSGGSAAGEMTNNSNHHSAAAQHVHSAIQAFYLGHTQRFHHFITKVPKNSPCMGRINGIGMMFIHGLNSCQLLKKQNTAKLRAIPKEAIVALKIAASQGVAGLSWNFRSKVHLLQAELQAFEGRHEPAQENYAAAITAARSSRFIHEQGLAYELAGSYYKRMGESEKAISFYTLSKKCYADWGSQIKADSIGQQLESLQIEAGIEKSTYT